MSRRPLGGKTTADALKLLVFVVVTVVATTGLALTIANVSLGESKEYSAIFSDVTGLETGDDIRISGVRVGEVQAIELAPGVNKATGAEPKPAARVMFSVDRAHTLPESINAAVRYRNLVGQRYIALTEGAGSSAPLEAGGTIPLAHTRPALDLTVLFNGFKPLFAALSPEDVNQLSYEIIRVLQGEAGTVESLLAHTASLTSTLADKEKVIDDLVDNLNVVLGTLAERDEKLSGLISELERFVSGLSADRKAIGNSLSSIVEIQRETADLLEESRGDISTDIAQLRKVAKTLDENSDIVERTIERMPEKLTDITRTATYGSWWNFYLCDFEGRIVLPDGTELPRTSLHVTAARCQR